MEIKDILSPDCTHCAVQGTSKKRILEIISQVVSDHLPSLEPSLILSSLLCREKMGSTGIGNGIAIPHGRIEGLEEVVAALITSDTTVEFDAIDNKPVDIFFAIFVPEGQAEGHLQTLAMIAGKLNDKNTIKRIRSARGNVQLFEAITQ
ncbi:PTS IIA-like nitrogen regulatory protein PtsN [Aestuariibacter sp. AA17]|uniref:PTS IIA-like nitrogen regulatory protein PtsN n=1 Tax=Fluctibacter corallii TaxID=2984329 RepID=A0ABT3A4P5_9ALTE|nr:PTS IIA-like nitrogen regulatory protein PtsN [Aestuariibacter sp. AA17]MCV2883662.1 PTS IIA-like nitrogen regulatory protein PtsN [Aestuariibacter sp. AA17]